MKRSELESLSSKELHDRAVSLAGRRLDAGFFWSVLKTIPAAAVATGHPEEAEVDALKLSALVNDAVHARETDIADALRPFYIDYLEREG